MEQGDNNSQTCEQCINSFVIWSKLTIDVSTLFESIVWGIRRVEHEYGSHHTKSCELWGYHKTIQGCKSYLVLGRCIYISYIQENYFMVARVLSRILHLIYALWRWTCLLLSVRISHCGYIWWYDRFTVIVTLVLGEEFEDRLIPSTKWCMKVAC